MGQRARRYFIECERRLREIAEHPENVLADRDPVRIIRFGVEKLLAKNDELRGERDDLRREIEMLKFEKPPAVGPPERERLKKYEAIDPDPESLDVRVTYTMHEAAAKCGLSRPALYGILRETHVIPFPRSRTPDDRWIDLGHFVMVAGSPRVTAKGLAWIRDVMIPKWKKDKRITRGERDEYWK